MHFIIHSFLLWHTLTTDLSHPLGACAVVHPSLGTSDNE